jgi:hypothetical protein
MGRLLNRYFEADANVNMWRLVPGLVAFADPAVQIPRGMHVVGNTLYTARAQQALQVSANGAVTPLAGTLNGVLPGSWAHNNKSPTPDIVFVSQEVGALYVSPSTGVAAYPDTSLPVANSVAMLDGYLLFTTQDGHIYASGVNDIWVSDSDHTQNALSYTLADQSGGLMRGTVWAEQYFAWGQKACTVYTNAATYPFPLGRTSIIPVGLLTFGAVTGWEPHWSLQQYFVADDCTVRRLDGYNASVVSVNDLERLIQAVVDKTQIEMSCYVEGGRAVVVVSGPTFTWEFNALTNLWNERQSPGQQRWRGSQSCSFNGRWLYGDTLSTQLVAISAAAYDELGTSFTARLESGAVKNFPSRGRCTAAFFDFTTGQAPISGNPDAVTPTLSISTSRDGGGTWSSPVIRESTGVQGDWDRVVKVHRIGGIFSQHGLRFRVDSSSPVYTTCRGGRADVQWFNPP